MRNQKNILWKYQRHFFIALSSLRFCILSLEFIMKTYQEFVQSFAFQSRKFIWVEVWKFMIQLKLSAPFLNLIAFHISIIKIRFDSRSRNSLGSHLHNFKTLLVSTHLPT